MPGTDPGHERAAAPDERPVVCGARTPDGPCQRDAGAQTPHEGRGCCNRHGGWLPSHRAKAFVDEFLERSQERAPSHTLGGDPAAADALRELLARHSRPPSHRGIRSDRKR